MNKNQPSLYLLTILVSCVATLLLAEVLLRSWYWVHNLLEPPFSERVSDLGWRPVANLSVEYSREGYGTISFTSVTDGFRRFGDPQTSNVKILVVGDSFTQAYHVSDGKAYYDYLDSEGFAPEVFAFAAGGYGTAQQVLALEQYIPQIEPDLIVWQFTGNDFINNDWQLESLSPENSSHMRRPFFEEGVFNFRHPDGALGTLAEYSVLIRRFLVIRGSYRKRTQGSIETELDATHPGLQRSVATTRTLIKRVAEQNPGTPIMAFFAGRHYYPWEASAFSSVCAIEELSCVHEVSDAVASAVSDGVRLDGGRDGHWNEAGHAIAGKVLLQALEKRLVKQ